MAWIEDTHEAVNVLYDEAAILESKANSLRSVGLTTLAEDLVHCASIIEEACKKITDALGKELSGQVKKASIMSQTMLEGVLAGITIGKGAEEKADASETPQEKE